MRARWTVRAPQVGVALFVVIVGAGRTEAAKERSALQRSAREVRAGEVRGPGWIMVSRSRAALRQEVRWTVGPRGWPEAVGFTGDRRSVMRFESAKPQILVALQQKLAPGETVSAIHVAHVRDYNFRGFDGRGVDRGVRGELSYVVTTAGGEQRDGELFVRLDAGRPLIWMRDDFTWPNTWYGNEPGSGSGRAGTGGAWAGVEQEPRPGGPDQRVTSEGERARRVIGVSASATPAEIKRAFRKRAQELAPDKPGNEGNNVRYRELIEAFRELLPD